MYIRYKSFGSPSLNPSPMLNALSRLGGGGIRSSAVFLLLRVSSSAVDEPWSWRRRFSSSSAERNEVPIDGLSVGEVLKDPAEAVVSGSVDASGLWPIMRVPVNIVIGLLDGVHAATGAPWWMVLVGSTLAMKAALFPLTVVQLKKTAKYAQFASKLPPPLPKLGSGKTIEEQYKEFTQKRKELAVPSPAWFVSSVAVQVPVFITWIVTVRHMAVNKYPGFDSGGALWFMDLTVPVQGYLGTVFPILVVVTYITNIEVSLKGVKIRPGLVGSLFTIYRWWLRGCAIPIFISGFYFPQGVFMYWLPNNLFSLAQSLLLRNSHVRRKMGLPLLQSPSKVDISAMDSDGLIKLAAHHVAQNNRNRAVQILQLAVHKDPDNATGYYALGKMHVEAEQWDKATELLGLAATKAKHDALRLAAHLALGIAMYNQGKIADGIAALKVVASMDVSEDAECRKKYIMVLVSLASMLSQEGEKIAALKFLQRAAQYDPTVGELYVKQLEKELEHAEGKVEEK